MFTDNKTKDLKIDSNADLIFKKGDYVHTYIVIKTSGMPDGATLHLLDENLNQLYSPYDVDGNQTKSICFITSGETDALQLPANYDEDQYTDFPVGTYNWKLKYSDGKITFTDKIIPITVEIRDFDIEKNLTQEIYPNENIQIKLRTYVDTVPTLKEFDTDRLTEQATYDATNGIITYPNSDITNLSVGTHTQAINQAKNYHLNYTIKNPIIFRSMYGDTHPCIYSRTIPIIIPQDCTMDFLAPKTNTNFIINGINYKATDKLNLNEEKQEYISRKFPPGSYNLTGTTILNDGNTYSVSGSFNVSTIGCSITLSRNENNIIATYMYNNETPIPNASIQILEDGIVVNTLITDSNGQCRSAGQIDNTYMAKAIDIDDSTLLTSNTMDFYPALYSDKNFVRQGEDITLTYYTGRENDDTDFIQKNQPFYFTWYNVSDYITITTDSTGTTFANNTDANRCIWANLTGTSTDVYDWDSPFVIEFDVVSRTGENTIIYGGTANSNIYRNFYQLGITGNNHIRIVGMEDMVYFYTDGELKYSASKDSANARFGFRISPNESFKFKNLKITGDVKVYPVDESIFVDKAITGEKNTRWNGTNVTISVESDGTLVSNSSGSSGSYTVLHPNTTTTPRYDYSFSSPLAIEFDIVNASDYTETNVQIVDSNGHIGLNKNLSYLDCKTADTHMKIIVTDAEVLVYTENKITFYYPHSMDANFRINFGLASGYDFKYKNFKIYETVETSTTNENGLTTLTYKGTGAGETNFYGKTNDFESNILTIDDYIPDPTTITLTEDKSIVQNGDSITLTASATDKYDLAVPSGYNINFIQKNKQLYSDIGTTNNHKDIWTVSTSDTSFIRGDNYTTFSKTVTGNKYAQFNISEQSICIEFEVYQVTGYINNIFLRVSSSTEPLYQCSLQKIGHYTGEWVKCRLTMKDGNVTFEDAEDSTKKHTSTYTGDIATIQLCLIGNDFTELRFRNFKLYVDEKVYPVGEIEFEDKGTTSSHNDTWLFRNCTDSIRTRDDNGTLLDVSSLSLSNNADVTPNTTSFYANYIEPNSILEFEVVDVDGENGEMEFSTIIRRESSNVYPVINLANFTPPYKVRVVYLSNRCIFYVDDKIIAVHPFNDIVNYRTYFNFKPNKATYVKYRNFKMYETVEFSTTDENGIATCQIVGDGSGLETYSAKCENIESNTIDVIDTKYYETIPNGALRNGYIQHQNIGNSAISLSNEWSTVGTHSIKTETNGSGWAGYRINNPNLTDNECIIQFDYKTNKITNIMALGLSSTENVVSMRADILEGTGEIYFYRDISEPVRRIELRQSNANLNDTVAYFDNIRIFDVPSWRKGYIWYDVGTDLINRGSWNDGYANAQLELTSQGIHMTNGRYTSFYRNRNAHSLDGSKDTVIEFDFKTANAIAHYLVDNSSSRTYPLSGGITDYNVWKHYKYVYHSDTKMIDVYVDGVQQTSVDHSDKNMTTFGFQFVDWQADGDWWIKNFKVYLL